MPCCRDHPELDSGSWTADPIKEIADLAKQHSLQLGAGRLAAVANNDLKFGHTRMLGVYVSGLVDSELQVFRTREEALDWLSG
jgi:hypothetical protein